jgi:hypothetical protein
MKLVIVQDGIILAISGAGDLSADDLSLIEVGTCEKYLRPDSYAAMPGDKYSTPSIVEKLGF